MGKRPGWGDYLRWLGRGVQICVGAAVLIATFALTKSEVHDSPGGRCGSTAAGWLWPLIALLAASGVFLIVAGSPARRVGVAIAAGIIVPLVVVGSRLYTDFGCLN